MSTLIADLMGREQKAISYSSPDMSVASRITINMIELLSGRRAIEEMYDELKLIDPDENIWSHIFRILNIRLDFNRSDLDEIPQSGPVIIIANHPYGVLDGMCLSYLISQRRKDFHLLVNEVLCREELLGKYFLPIDFRETKAAQRTNILSRSRAIEYLKSGSIIGIFPGGGVATTRTIWSRKALDLPWKRFVVQLIRKSGAPILPIYFEGQNSALFQIASHIKQDARLGLLLHELNNKRKKPVQLKIGKLIQADEISSDVDEALTKLYQLTHSLATT